MPYAFSPRSTLRPSSSASYHALQRADEFIPHGFRRCGPTAQEQLPGCARASCMHTVRRTQLASSPVRTHRAAAAAPCPSCIRIRTM
jgi:hypothetical protein